MDRRMNCDTSRATRADSLPEPLFLVVASSEQYRQHLCCQCRAWECATGDWRQLPGLLQLWVDADMLSEQRAPPRLGHLYALAQTGGQIWQEPGSMRNPGGVDFKSILNARGVLGSLPRSTLANLVDYGPASPEYRCSPSCIDKVRVWLAERVYHRVENASTAGLLCAMLFGMRGGLDVETRDTLRTGGLSHLLAVSGLHVGMLAVLVYFALSVLPVSQQIRRWLALILLVAYVPLAGGQSSVRRAVCMACLLGAGGALGRKQTAIQTLWTTGALALAIQPDTLFDIGFQLSWVAVWSLLRLAVPWHKRLQDRIPTRIQPWTAWLSGGLCASMAVNLGTAPLVFAHFGRLPLAGLWLNLLAIPLAGGLLLCAVLLLLLPLPGQPLGKLAELLHWLLCYTTELSPQPALYWSPGWTQVLLVSVALLFVIHRPRPARFLIAASLLLCATDLLPRLQENRQLQCLLVDVGQGDGILLRTTRSDWWLVDTGWAGAPGRGGHDAAREAILPAMRALGVHRLRGLVLTHPDQDHLGAALSILQEVEVDSLYHGGRWRDNLSQHLLRSRLALHGPPMRRIEAGDVLWEEAGSTARVLWPPSRSWPEDANEASIVLGVEAAGGSLLLTGDIGHPAEGALSVWEDWLCADVLKLGHHGSGHSSCAAFLQQVQPQLGLVSCGADNRYGHPSQEVLDRCDTLGITLWRTDLQGACWLSCDTEGWKSLKWRSSMPWSRPYASW